jgi:hypothetical protein
VLPVSLLVRPLLPHLSKLPVTVHLLDLMAGNVKNNFGGKNSILFFGGPSGWAMVMGPVLPVSLIVRPLLPLLSKLLVTVHPVGLMAGNVKNNFGGKNSNLFYGGPSGWAMVMGPVLPVSLLVRPLLPLLSNLLVTVHPVGLMVGNVKNNFGGKNSILFFGRPIGWAKVIVPVLPVPLLALCCLCHCLYGHCLNYNCTPGGPDGGKSLKKFCREKFNLVFWRADWLGNGHCP